MPYFWTPGRCGVSQLHEGLVLADLVEQRLAGEHARRGVHAPLLGDLPDVVPDFLQGDAVGVVGGHTR
jgi:hypothetical protein